MTKLSREDKLLMYINHMMGEVGANEKEYFKTAEEAVADFETRLVPYCYEEGGMDEAAAELLPAGRGSSETADPGQKYGGYSPEYVERLEALLKRFAGSCYDYGCLLHLVDEARAVLDA